MDGNVFQENLKNNEMNKSEEILDYHCNSLPVWRKEAVLKAMKEYAFYVSMNALQDAADKYEGVHMRDSFGCTCDVSSAIKSTLIEI